MNPKRFVVQQHRILYRSNKMTKKDAETVLKGRLLDEQGCRGRKSTMTEYIIKEV